MDNLNLLLDGVVSEDFFLIETEPDRVKYLLSKGLPIAIVAALLSMAPDAVAKVATTVPVASKKPALTKSQISFQRDITIIAKTLYHEARGEGFEGMFAVASVIWNRANGDTSKFDDVCLAKNRKTGNHAFSCWNKKSLPSGSGELWDQAVQIATKMKYKAFKPLHSYTHYYNPDLADPKWAYMDNGDRQPFKDIGNHRFLTVESLEIENA